MSQNQLKDATSPYLLQHKDQPVHWRVWSAETLAAARKDDKPILLSIGYSACHWCHVMAHESFDDPEIAKLINALFIPVKVDREERPDIDAHYMQALHDMGERGGWPLTMFLTPAAEPFWGGTYFPKEARGGMAGLKDILPQIADIHAKQGEDFLKNRDFFRQRLKERAERERSGAIRPEAPMILAKHLLGGMDALYGGFKGAPKFPQAPLLDLLWRAYLRDQSERPAQRDALRAALLNTLRALCQGGIYDHLGGGFARYAVDEAWRVPHFEKMLYDNALILALLTEAFRETRSPLFEARIYETVGFLLREMLVKGGAFAASLDADQEGAEGRFYVWRSEEMDALLGGGSPWVKRVYDVREGGHWEGVNTLHRLHENGDLSPQEEARLKEAKGILFEAREARPRPALDDKILADWNGMAIAALARAGDLFGEDGWGAAARDAFSFICDNMTTKEGGLFHSSRSGRVGGKALAEDYAQMIAASLALYETGRDQKALAWGERFAAALEARHWDEGRGGYNMSAHDSDDVPTERLDAEDGATPSANGLMLHLLPRLFILTGEPLYAKRAAALSSAFGRDCAARPQTHATWLSGLAASASPVSVVIVGEKGKGDDAGASPLLEAARRISFPEMILLTTSPEETLPPSHPARGKGLVGGRAAAYICEGARCSLPITDPDALLDALRKARALSEL